MDLVPCEILEIIANNLDLRDIINLRNSSKFIYDCLNHLYHYKLEKIRWKITVHMFFNVGFNRFEINKSWISIGEFPVMNSIYPHEICEECNSNDDKCHGDKKSHQIYTLIREGIGGRLIPRLLDDKLEIIVTWDPTTLNQGNSMKINIVGDGNPLYLLSETTKPTLVIGDLIINNNNNFDVIYGYHGPLSDKVLNNLDSPYNWQY